MEASTNAVFGVDREGRSSGVEQAPSPTAASGYSPACGRSFSNRPDYPLGLFLPALSAGTNGDHFSEGKKFPLPEEITHLIPQGIMLSPALPTQHPS